MLEPNIYLHNKCGGVAFFCYGDLVTKNITYEDGAGICETAYKGVHCQTCLTDLNPSDVRLYMSYEDAIKELIYNYNLERAIN